MAGTQTQGNGNLHLASAQMKSLPISTKHSIELSRHLRFKSCRFARSFLEDVISLSKPVPFKRFTRDIGDKNGMAIGRYPFKAVKVFLNLVKSVEKNAEDIGLNSESLKIVHLLANKASIPMTGGRTKGATKRTHIEIKVAEAAEKAEAKPKKQIKTSKKENKSAKKEVSGIKETEKVTIEKNQEIKKEKVEDQKISVQDTGADAAKTEKGEKQ
mgnify:CR=1 FL=1